MPLKGFVGADLDMGGKAEEPLDDGFVDPDDAPDADDDALNGVGALVAIGGKAEELLDDVPVATPAADDALNGVGALVAIGGKADELLDDGFFDPDTAPDDDALNGVGALVAIGGNADEPLDDGFVDPDAAPAADDALNGVGALVAIGGKAEELPDFFSSGLLKGLVGAAALIGGKAAPPLSFFVWEAKPNGAGASELDFLVSSRPEVPAGVPNENPLLPIPVDAFAAPPNEKPEAFAAGSFVFESSFKGAPKPPNENPLPLLLVLLSPADDAPKAPPNEKPLDPIDPDALSFPGFDAGNDEVDVTPPNVNPPLPIEPCAG